MIDRVRKNCLFSEHGEPDMEKLVLQFIAELPPRIRALGAALQDGDSATMLRISGALKGEASVVGFPTLSETAAVLEEMLLASASADEIPPLVQKLAKQCLGARAAGAITEFNPGDSSDAVVTPRINSARRL